MFSGRFDARLDLGDAARRAGRARGGRAGRPGSPTTSRGRPRVLVVGASPDDRASIARAAARKGIGESLAYAPALPLAGPRRTWSAAPGRVLLPVVSEAAGLPAIEALACGTPVVASAVGPLPELIGAAGLLVEPRDADRLAVALATIWADDGVHARIAGPRRSTGRGASARTWADVARETRADLRRRSASARATVG